MSYDSHPRLSKYTTLNFATQFNAIYAVSMTLPLSLLSEQKYILKSL